MTDFEKQLFKDIMGFKYFNMKTSEAVQSEIHTILKSYRDFDNNNTLNEFEKELWIHTFRTSYTPLYINSKKALKNANDAVMRHRETSKGGKENVKIIRKFDRTEICDDDTHFTTLKLSASLKLTNSRCAYYLASRYIRSGKNNTFHYNIRDENKNFCWNEGDKELIDGSSSTLENFEEVHQKLVDRFSGRLLDKEEKETDKIIRSDYHIVSDKLKTLIRDRGSDASYTLITQYDNEIGCYSYYVTDENKKMCALSEKFREINCKCDLRLNHEDLVKEYSSILLEKAID